MLHGSANPRPFKPGISTAPTLKFHAPLHLCHNIPEHPGNSNPAWLRIRVLQPNILSRGIAADLLHLLEEEPRKLLRNVRPGKS